MQDILEKVVMNNRISDYITSLLFMAGGILAIKIIEKVLLLRFRLRAERTSTTLDDFVVEVVDRRILPVIFFGVFYMSLLNLALSSAAKKVVDVAGVVVLTFFAVRIGVSVACYAIENYYSDKEGGDTRVKNMRTLLPVIKTVIWGIGITFLLDNLGFRISSVIAGLGIGGIAVALAAQVVLGDVFSYFSIQFDRPFELGDFIIVGEFMGTIEHVGIKTTRIRSLGGEQIVFSNTDLTNSRVRNYKRMQERRVVFRFGVTYQTANEKLALIPHVVREILDEIENARYDRAHFLGFGDFSLNFEVVYYVMDNDYNKYMDIQQRINMELKKRLEGEGIEFAYPTQTLFINRSGQA